MSLSFFGTNLLTLFCKLDLFIEMEQILLMFIIWSSLQKVLVNLCLNSFMRSTPGLAHKYYTLLKLVCLLKPVTNALAY
jgi:hypothetical protein